MFPQIAVPENITYADKLTGTVAYRSNAVYIIAIDRDHMPDILCSYHSPKLDDKHFFRMFQAEHYIVMDETGRITEEQKKFIDTDTVTVCRTSPRKNVHSL